jgi:hypothetical protein
MGISEINSNLKENLSEGLKAHYYSSVLHLSISGLPYNGTVVVSDILGKKIFEGYSSDGSIAFGFKPECGVYLVSPINSTLKPAKFIVR